MSGIRDRLRADLEPETVDLLRRLATAPVLVSVNRRACHCPLGTVRRVDDRQDYLAGTRRVLVRVALDGPKPMQARDQPYHLHLNDPNAFKLFHIGCNHGTFDDAESLRKIREHVSAVARGDVGVSKPLSL